MTEAEVTSTSPDRLSSFRAYIQHCVDMAGSNVALAKVVDFSSGSRVGDWLSGDDGRPNPLATMKLAEFSGDDLLEVLRLCGHKEIAGIIERMVSFRRGLPEVYRQRLGEAIEPLEKWVREMRAYTDKL